MKINRTAQFLILGLILFIGVAIRFNDIAYGLYHACLALPQEDWLYDEPQVSSLYSWDVAPYFNEVEEIINDPLIRTELPTTNDLVFMRLLGAVIGILSIALIIKLGFVLKSNSWWLGGFFVALGPWFVESDRWVIRFDFATLAVAISILAMLLLHQGTKRGRDILSWLHVAGAMSLLLISPPLWWLAIGLIVIYRQVNWRVALFLLISGILVIPALQTPIHWINATQAWDMGAVAALVWAGTAFVLWYWRKIIWWVQAGLLIITLLLGGYSILQIAQLPRPTVAEWELIDFLQDIIPDESLVRFDQDTWHLHSVVACSRSNPIVLEAQPQPVFRPYLPGVRAEPPVPAVAVASSEATLRETDTDFIYTIGDFWVGRTVKTGNSTDTLFGNYLHVMGYEILTETLQPNQILDVQLDFQFNAHMDEEITIHAMFIHVIPPGQPGDQLINISVPITDMQGLIEPRGYALNQHIRTPIPMDAEPGTYDVIFGMFNTFSGERVESIVGNAMPLGQIEIVTPE